MSKTPAFIISSLDGFMLVPATMNSHASHVIIGGASPVSVCASGVLYVSNKELEGASDCVSKIILPLGNFGLTSG